MGVPEMEQDEVHVYLGVRTLQWYWKRVAPNGETISQGEGYTQKGDAVRGARRANRDAQVLVTRTPE